MLEKSARGISLLVRKSESYHYFDHLFLALLGSLLHHCPRLNSNVSICLLLSVIKIPNATCCSLLSCSLQRGPRQKSLCIDLTVPCLDVRCSVSAWRGSIQPIFCRCTLFFCFLPVGSTEGKNHFASSWN